MLRPILLTAIAASLLLVASGVSAAPPAASTPDEAPGPVIGTKVPDFTLPDQDGVEHTLTSLLERGQLAIVFYRSADW